MNKYSVTVVSTLFVLATLAACGGGGGGGGSAATLPPNKAFGTAALIETDNAGDASSRPQVAIDTNGNALAVWRQSDGTRYNIWANRYTAGTGWGTAALIETDNAGNAFDPQVAIDTNGNALAVWQQYDGTRYNIWANRYQ